MGLGAAGVVEVSDNAGLPFPAFPAFTSLFDDLPEIGEVLTVDVGVMSVTTVLPFPAGSLAQASENPFQVIRQNTATRTSIDIVTKEALFMLHLLTVDGLIMPFPCKVLLLLATNKSLLLGIHFAAPFFPPRILGRNLDGHFCSRVSLCCTDV